MDPSSLSASQARQLIQQWYEIAPKQDATTDERVQLYSDTEKLAAQIEKNPTIRLLKS